MSQFLDFTLANSNQLDGGETNELFDQHVRRAAQDCMDRPFDEKPRKITLMLTLIPVLDKKTRDCEQIIGQMHVTSVVPPHTTKGYSFTVNKKGKLLFNPDSPDNVNQATLISDDEK